ncbi:hypothetical protein HanIR_Chr17g0892691 [Helianthus annuus]|nr:hypothetical protein HanIR_Chr17g0892691 [Helianthus annuus]
MRRQAGCNTYAASSTLASSSLCSLIILSLCTFMVNTNALLLHLLYLILVTPWSNTMRNAATSTLSPSVYTNLSV